MPRSLPTIGTQFHISAFQRSRFTMTFFFEERRKMTASAKSGEIYEQILASNLQRAVDFLKFAEAKNAALLALSSAWVVASINLVCSGKSVRSQLGTGILVALFCSLCAALAAMASFFPKLHLPGFLGGKKAGPHPKNLLYFGDISSLPIRTLEADLYKRYYPSGGSHTDEYLHDLIVQIAVNSQIANRKMRLFSLGLCFILSASAALFLPALNMLFTSIKPIW